MQKSGVSVEPDGFSGPAHVNPSGISHVSFYYGSQWECARGRTGRFTTKVVRPREVHLDIRNLPILASGWRWFKRPSCEYEFETAQISKAHTKALTSQASEVSGRNVYDQEFNK